ncbi:MAG: SDR family oxidoreductase [Deltaproteobacteria bacterium]|nr:SDR family oxidoreductase [Deltaproteobacteria bacterium]
MNPQPTVARALITGASTGIGRSFAEILAEQGTDLVLVARDTKRLDELAAQIRDQHSRHVQVLTADLTRADELATVAERLSSDPAIDLLVNNAGFGSSGFFADLDLELAEGQIDLNIKALTKLAHAALSRMRSAGTGSIINLASGAAFLPTPGAAVYAATKAYVTSFSQALHEEVSDDGITVTAVCPGFTRTEFQVRGSFATEGVPDFAWQSAEDVVHESLDALSRREVVRITGRPNRAMLGLVRLLPLSRIASLAARFTPGAGKH